MKNIVGIVLSVVLVSSVIANIQINSLNKQTEIINSSNKIIKQLIDEKEVLNKQVLDLKKQALPL